MDNLKMEEIYNETFAGLTLFYRDTNLPENLIDKYKIGQIIMEKGFTDMSYKGRGLSTNFRYLIASSNAKDLSAFNPDASKCGLVVLKSKAFFKVLDIYKISVKTQIFLLNIPEHAIGFFKNSTSNIEKEIIHKARKGFEEKIKIPEIEELQTPYWKKRTEFPIGMNDDGEMFFDDTKLTKS